MDNMDQNQNIPNLEPKSEDSILVPKINVQNTEEPKMDPPMPQPADPPADPPPSVQKMEPIDPSKPKTTGKKKWIWIGIAAFLVLFLIYNVIAGLLIYQKGMKLADSVSKLQAAANSKDLAQIKTQIGNTRASLGSFDSTFKLLSWIKVIPFAGPYMSDAGHAVTAGEAGLDAGDIVITTIEPYSDLLGLKDGGTQVLAAKTGAQSMQERIDFVVKSIPDLLPKLDAISAKVKIVDDELSKINADRYPDTFKGHQVKSQIQNIQQTTSEAANLLVNGKPFLKNLPFLLGMDAPRTYLILFQNDKELRPTGGFMTAYAIMKVDKAKFEPVSSSDIYTLDAQYKPSIQAPDPIVKYIKGPYILSQNLRLRDMNWSPDFAVSMLAVDKAIATVGIKNVDGIIGVDTQLLTNLLGVIGQIGVPGFGNFSNQVNPKCNCPDVIYQLESFADVEGPIIWDPLTGKIILRPPNSDNRKKIIGPLMNSILANALGQPKEKLPALFEAGFKSLVEKHVLLYAIDQSVQGAISGVGLGGTIRTDFTGDYLHINDANLGGRKSNLYATEDVEQDISIAGDGTVTKTVTITYKNPQSQDGWLNSVLPTWVRVYVPKGSTLVTSEGLEAKTDPYEDLGHTVFAGYFQLRPEGVSKVTFQYKLPFKVRGTYDLLIQKQPGTDGFLYTVKLGNHSEEFYLKTDKELKIDL